MHNNIFRRSLNGTWGTSIFESGAMAGDSQNIVVGCTLDSSWDESNISVVAYAYNLNSGEIVQVESTELL